MNDRSAETDDRPTLLVPHTVPPDSAADFEAAFRERLPDAPIEVASTPGESRDLIPEAEAIATFTPPEDLLAAAENLQWIQALSAGVDSYPLEDLEERGIAVTNASGVHAEPIAEQVLGYMLAFERELHTAIRQQDKGIWERFRAGELRGKTLGIVGVGAIGERVAQLGATFEMTVLGTKRDTSETPDGVDELFGPDEASLHEVCRRSDYLVLACPLTDETEGLIGRWELRMMPEEAVLINVARGEVVDQSALLRSLQQRAIGGAALDVFDEEPLPGDSPLWDLSNVILTPHMAGSTPEYYRRCAEITADNYERLVAGEDLRNRVR